MALLSVGALVILNAFATTLAHPNPADVVAGKDLDPVSTAVVASFGGWSRKPFAAMVLVAFIACGMAAQAGPSRGIYSVARDGVLPGSKFLRRVDRRQAPLGGIVATTLVAWAGLLLGLEATAIGSLIAFGTAAIFFAFLLIAIAALYGRPPGRAARARARVVLNVSPCLARLRDGQHRLAASLARPARARPGTRSGRRRWSSADRRHRPGLSRSARGRPMAAELAIVGARVRTLDPAQPFARAVAVERRDDQGRRATTCASTATRAPR